MSCLGEEEGGERTLRYTTSKDLKLSFIEIINEFLRDELVEAFHERGVLFLDTFGRAILDYQTNMQARQHLTQYGRPRLGLTRQTLAYSPP